MSELRIGILGAATIAPLAIIRPARQVANVTVTAIAARHRGRAEAFARKHAIPAVRDSYADLLADPDIDAVYIPLPNALHAEWTLRAIQTGKHVLCEKPLTANRAEAEEVAATAERARHESARVVMEAFHYRYHPLAERLRTIVHGTGRGNGEPGSGGELGPLRRVEVSMCIPLPFFSDIRYRYDLAGGATMDAGCYVLHLARLLAGETPRIISATARGLRKDARIDRAMTAELAFPGGASGQIRASLWSRCLLSLGARVAGERGELKVNNFLFPHYFHRVRIRTAEAKRAERVPGKASYVHQLEAFAAAARNGADVLTPARDAVITMGLIDDVYRAAGLPVRGA
jgi:predicted dehydrogenase